MKALGSTVLVLTALLAWVTTGCDSDAKPPDGTAGTAGTGGTGGTSGAGGTAGTGGDGGLTDPNWTPDYYPTTDWRTRTPEEAGYDSALLQKAIDLAAATPTQSLLVVQDGYIVREVYLNGWSAEQRHESFSMAKSFTSALVGIAIEEKLLSGVEEKLCKFYPVWDCSNTSDQRSEIEIRHAMSLSTGLKWKEAWEPGTDLTQNDAVLMFTSPRPIDFVLSKSSEYPPGTHFQYSTGDPALLSGVLQSVTGKNALAYANDKLFTKMGTTGIQWRSDADGKTTTFAGLSATAREYAKFGLLYLNRGKWEGQQLVPAAWVDSSTRTGPSLEDWYGYLWHVNLPVRFEDPALPADGYTAQGVGGQFITVIPSKRLVVVRLASDGIAAAEFDLADLIKLILEARTTD